MSLRFGNCNNDLNDGPRARNWNNDATNANWNISFAVFYSNWNHKPKDSYLPTPQTVEIPFIRHYWLGE